MALPTPVQRQLDAAAAAEQALQQAQAPEPTQPAAESQEAQAQPPQPPAPAPAPAPAPEPVVDYEQRFKTVQGMLNAERRQSQAALQQAQEREAAIQRQLAELREKVEAAQAQQKPATDTQDHKDFGEDLVEMVRRQTALMLQQFQGVATKLEGRVAALEQNLGGVSQRTTMTLEQQFYATLDGLVPDWKTVNDDERWLAWLAELDPIYGAPRQAALDNAFHAFDAKRVANVFAAFKATLPKSTPAPSLESQVAPSTAPTGAPAPQPAKQIVSVKEIEAFYRDIAQGKYRDRQAEQGRKEQFYNLATAEGRLKP